ncbi:hypothetical protein [Mesorhizobium sp. NZP2077]|uniref:hypothetical protein n=1 Tax=Mesorhizobium sp. NZP2077 TaxID=2483404 RepID=UPI0015539292|nr:hypothetical protein [Mesorhizobium sp. NZP2077]QKD19189.1 hypothetical protein HGP13_31655 [Mesorhizobium sp. NZP2077]
MSDGKQTVESLQALRVAVFGKLFAERRDLRPGAGKRCRPSVTAGLMYTVNGFNDPC